MHATTATYYEHFFADFFDRPADPRETLAQLEQLSEWLDNSITIPGTNYKIGWDSIVGMIPGIGDVITATLSGWIVLQAKRLGVSNWTLARMIANVGIDSLFGAVPLAGDVFDAAFKSNKKNIALLKKHLESRSQQRGDVVDAAYAKVRSVS